MDLAAKMVLQSIKDDATLAINSKAQKIFQVLEQRGHMYEQLVHPSQLIVHQENRSGMMINSFDCHKTGLQSLKVGWQESKVKESFCFEVSQENGKKDLQFGAMKSLVTSSDKRLAPVAGLERFRALSCSHISLFAKAVYCGECHSELDELQAFTFEALQSQFKDEQFGKMMKHGWSCKIIQHQVEDDCPCCLSCCRLL